MKLFAHRGNIKGSIPEKENKKEYLEEALNSGYGVECDVFYSSIEDELYLGHDSPTQRVDKNWLINDNILVHAKTVATFDYLSQFKNIHCFYQDKELVVFTNRGLKLYHETESIKRLSQSKYIERLDASILVDINGLYSSDMENNYNAAYGYISDKVWRINPKKVNEFTSPKLIILDIDGVMTNGKKIYNINHKAEYKEFCDKDFTIIKHIQAAGINVVALTGDSFNRDMCSIRNIPYWNAKEMDAQLNKEYCGKTICKHYKTELKDTVYIGDDYYDIGLLSIVGWKFCPADAIVDVQKIKGMKVLQAKGGENVLEKMFDYLNIPKVFPYER